MLYEISKDVSAALVANNVPLPVVYGPERVDAMASVGRQRIVFERDRELGDGVELNMRARPTNPIMIAVRPIGAVCRVYAQSTIAGAAVHDHERIADQAVDKVVAALRKVVATRRTLWRVSSSKLLSAAELEERGLERWPGVVYELRFSVDRGVTDTTWIGEARPEVTIGGEGGVTIATTDEIYLDKAPAGATPETGC